MNAAVARTESQRWRGVGVFEFVRVCVWGGVWVRYAQLDAHMHTSPQQQIKHHLAVCLPACPASQLEQFIGVLMKTKRMRLFDRGWHLIHCREGLKHRGVLLLTDEMITKARGGGGRWELDKQISPIQILPEIGADISANVETSALHTRRGKKKPPKNWRRLDTLFYERLSH